ncbi:hypothetical protein CK203_005015 [Vitis vinifera]|uniref:Transmembrane protein n=1 Tax=Vitis vinifera TaxID=29760 RepID=A0A438KED8_VITVI|nr:hypothetical protein CK203_005015 [Vitis vinifera]
MSGKEEWRKMADTHMMKDEEVKTKGVEASKRPPGHNPGEVLHQRRKLPYSPPTMAVAGFLIAATLGYFTLYAMKKLRPLPKMWPKLPPARRSPRTLILASNVPLPPIIIIIIIMWGVFFCVFVDFSSCFYLTSCL